MRRKIIIDTDPGKDDAVAILLALASAAELELLGIVAVAGNVPLKLSAGNVRKVCELAGRTDLPVHAGCAKPMYRQPITAEHVHGQTGLGRLQLPAPQMPLQPAHGVDFLIDQLRQADDAGITLCTLGPLTDVGTALVRAPDIVKGVRELVMMGGGYFQPGNVTPAAEFNVYADPHAASIVLQSGIPITMMPLDVTHMLLTTPARIEVIRALGNRCAVAVAELLDVVEEYDVVKFGPGSAPLHDPSVIAYLLCPQLFAGRKVNVTVETESPLTIGMTVADWWSVTGKPANVLFMNSVHAAGFYDLLTERLASLR
jgi:purine nucleosidase